MTKKGLYCSAGDFYIDPKGAVDFAIVTHAHSDHARRGSRHYLCATSGIDLLKARIGKSIFVQGLDFGEKLKIKGVTVSLHPAGHILGSAQVRIESHNELWVASGDYKRDADPTCEPFEQLTCDVFVTEATFGTPGYNWPKGVDLGQDIFKWWEKNAAQGYNSVLFAYSLGKAQRVLGVLHPHAKKAIHCHSAVTELNHCYHAQGIKLAPTKCISQLRSHERLEGELVLVPQAFLKSPQAEILGGRFRTAFASGWMAKGSFGFNTGFIMSDHADWNDLVHTIKSTNAKRVYVQHRGYGALVKHLRLQGIQAYPDSDLTSETPSQLALF